MSPKGRSFSSSFFPKLQHTGHEVDTRGPGLTDSESAGSRAEIVLRRSVGGGLGTRMWGWVGWKPEA
eukprot:1840553-Rhodomonas_salina.1